MDPEGCTRRFDAHAHGIEHGGRHLGCTRSPSGCSLCRYGQHCAEGGDLDEPSRFAGKWVESDPAAAARWLDRLPAGAVRDTMVRALSYRALEDDPEGAIAWAATMSKAEERASQISSLAEHWMDNDPTAAAKWITASRLLTPEVKAQLLKRE